MFRAYFDDGGTDGQTPMSGVAGYVSTERQWMLLEKRWRKLIESKPYELEAFHMTDFESRKPPYDKLTNAERHALITGLIKITKDYTICGFRAGIRSGAFQEVDHESNGLLSTLWGNSYAWCAASCMGSVGKWIRRHGNVDGVVYVYAKTHKGNSYIKGNYGRAYANPVERKHYRLAVSEPVFELSKNLPGLQAADISAYETWKTADRQFGKESRKHRLSAIALWDPSDFGPYFDVPELRRYVRYKRDGVPPFSE